MSLTSPRVLRRWRHRLREAFATLLRRLPVRRRAVVVPLQAVRAQLEYYLCAMYGARLSIEPEMPDRHESAWHARLGARVSGRQLPMRSRSVAHRIILPATLPAVAHGVAAAAQYRLLAAQHAERVMRRSALQLAPDAPPLERDLFTIADAAAVDRTLARTQPGLAATLAGARRKALAERGRIVRHMALERRVESLLHETLRAGATVDAPIPDAPACAAWARDMAATLAAQHVAAEVAAYRGIGPLMLWDTAILTGGTEDQPGMRSQRDDPFADRSEKPRHAKRTKTVSSPARDSSSATETKESDSSSDSAGDQQPGVDASPAAEKGTPALQAGARDEQSIAASGLAMGRGVARERANALPPGIRYPEWDVYADDFRANGAIVRVQEGTASSSGWADQMLGEHAILVGQLRRQFDRMRVDRAHLTRQLRGEELDLDMCVAALVDRRMGRTPDERLYTAVRPGHRPLALALLVDASASTTQSADGGAGLRVIDLERLALLVAAEALEALGNEWAAYAFASDGESDVRVTALKAFTERHASIVRERVSALEPAGATRLGAAIRHATRELLQRPVAHRLLVILSDGKPNDRDRYSIDYAVADSRRAVIEGRLAGVHTHCITVDPNEPEDYMADIFGETGYLLVAHPAQLPRALAGAVQRLLT